MAALFAVCSVTTFAQGPASRGEEQPAFRGSTEETGRNRLLEGPETRRALAAFAHCVVEKDAVRIGAVLNRDFRTSAYGKALDRLTKTNRDCMDKTGHASMRVQNLPLAAALSEELLERDRTPLNVRLARAAAGKPAETFGPSDTLAMCVAKSAPDDVAGLFAAEADSEAEKAAVKTLAPALSACARAVGLGMMQTTEFGLRSILATAAYRLLAAQSA